MEKLQSSLVQTIVQMIKTHAALKCAGRQKKLRSLVVVAMLDDHNTITGKISSYARWSSELRSMVWSPANKYSQ